MPFALRLDRYCRLPMEVTCAPDIAQEIMESLLRHLDSVECYIDDIGCFDDNWSNHLKTLEAVLTILQDNISRLIRSSVSGPFKKRIG